MEFAPCPICETKKPIKIASLSQHILLKHIEKERENVMSNELNIEIPNNNTFVGVDISFDEPNSQNTVFDDIESIQNAKEHIEFDDNYPAVNSDIDNNVTIQNIDQTLDGHFSVLTPNVLAKPLEQNNLSTNDSNYFEFVRGQRWHRSEQCSTK